MAGWYCLPVIPGIKLLNAQLQLAIYSYACLKKRLARRRKSSVTIFEISLFFDLVLLPRTPQTDYL
jgi:hypothetical protein